MKKYISYLLLPLLLSGCSLLDQRKAVAINDTIIRANNELGTRAESYGTLLGKAIAAKNYEALKPERVKLGQFVDSATNVISSMEDVGGSEEFRNYELQYLRFEKKFINEGFTPFEQFDSNTPMDELKTAWLRITDFAEKEKPFVTKLKSLQVAYAEKNHFKLDPNKK